MTEKKYERYYDLAGKASFENRKSIGESRMCGCYFCRRVFPASEVTEWISDTRGDTAVCPYCSIDSVIGDASGIPLWEDVLEEIREFMFGGPEPEAPRPARCVGSGNDHLHAEHLHQRKEDAGHHLVRIGAVQGDVHAGVTALETLDGELQAFPAGLRVVFVILEFGADVQTAGAADAELAFVLGIQVDEDVALQDARLEGGCAGSSSYTTSPPLSRMSWVYLATASFIWASDKTGVAMKTVSYWLTIVC